MPGLESRQSISPILKKLSEWFKRPLTEGQLDIWYQQIKHMPLEALQDIAESIIRSQKVFPTPQEVQSAYSDWVATHPQKIDRQRYRQPCSHCHGDGYYPVWRSFPGYRDPVIKREIWSSTLIACPYCPNYKDSIAAKAPRLTPTECIAKGWKLEDPDLEIWRVGRDKRIAEQQSHSIPDLVNQIKDIPDEDIPF